MFFLSQQLSQQPGGHTNGRPSQGFTARFWFRVLTSRKNCEASQFLLHSESPYFNISFTALLYQARHLRVINVPSDCAVLDALNGFVDNKEWHKNHSRRFNRGSKAVAEFYLQLYVLEYAVNEVLQFDSVHVVKPIRRNHLYIGHKERWV